ncbi:MAG: hypothetical protein OWP43_13035 [Sphaerochaetaceae bacterium]|nr:hypothetical protein [Sphaerochaetaceae bacterium]
MIKSIILTILVILTFINLYLITIGKRQKKKNLKQLEILRESLEKSSIEILKSTNMNISSKHFFVTDINRGFLLIFDKINKKFIVINETGFDIFEVNSFKECKSKIIIEGKFLLLSATILTTDKNSKEFIFGSKKRKSKSLFGKFIIDTTNQFTHLINTFINENR